MLVVEDDRTARRAIAHILKKNGYVVSEAATLADGLREADVQRPAWILLDLMLPDGSGTELLRRMRGGALPPARVCVITGCATAAVGEARALEPEHVFTKPLDVEGLLAVMAR